MRIEDTSYGNSKHLGSSTTAYKPLKDHLSKYKRERSPTPNHPPFYCNAITRRSTHQVHEDNEEEEREYEEQLMMKMKSRASTSMLLQNRARIHLALLTLVSHQHHEVKLLNFQDWKQCKDHHHLLKKKILGI
ncbi:unnamed protein product [Microthlaspi erraticum]|uniref:Uncharacterized protein n=1 Tax=Microthlaspi erraticum TaxID=1685480 RepID=A0A6D2J3U3_9BRAS|nr:unnamed protein product [Microthlaspi erraticum]